MGSLELFTVFGRRQLYANFMFAYFLLLLLFCPVWPTPVPTLDNIIVYDTIWDERMPIIEQEFIKKVHFICYYLTTTNSLVVFHYIYV